MSAAAHSFVALVDQHALNKREKVAIEFIGQSFGQLSSLTYGELNERATQLARLLMDYEKGSRAVLLFPPCIEFSVAFLACLKANIIAVPLSLPINRHDEAKLASAIVDCDPTLLLTVKSIAEMPQCNVLKEGFPQIRWVSVDQYDEVCSNSVLEIPGQNLNDVAFLQYTSGSTGNPKGVEVTHGNITANERMIASAFGTQENDIGVSWLPVYHDMGLIGSLLQSLYIGGTSYLMSPLDFLQRPLRWLQAISDKSANISGGPNFAYDMCVKRVSDEDARKLDLSRWRVAFNGAEPIKASTMRAFTERFSRLSKFSPEAIFPCYGLAEATLLVSGGPRGSGMRTMQVDASALQTHEVRPINISDDPTGSCVVSSGRLAHELNVEIVEVETLKLAAPGRVGEIWIEGPSVARGYWKNPKATAETFGATLAERPNRVFLRTGDLGFINEENELMVTGRLKDVIIIRGRNHYPQDIERVVEDAHAAVRKGCVAAFVINENKGVSVAAEIRSELIDSIDYQAVKSAVRQEITAATGLAVEQITLVPAGKVSKTTSGKIRRKDCHERIVRGTLRCLSEVSADVV